MDDHIKMKRKHDAVKKLHNERYEVNSRKRLMKNIEKKFKTTMIGALSQFEKEFGNLWGFSENSITVNQAKFERKWQVVRTEILNNGNNQLRACLDEIAQYTMTWNRYKTSFIVKKDNEENNYDKD